MLSKYYSLDECYNRDSVLDHLEELQSEEVILYEIIDSDVLKLKDIGLSEKQTKDLIQFLDENDVIDYPDFEPYDEDEDDDYFDDEDDYYRDELY
jgi:hypothetical protein